MKGKALMCTCRTEWVNTAVDQTPRLGVPSVGCPLFSSPQHKPGSDRIKGQTPLSSDEKYT